MDVIEKGLGRLRLRRGVFVSLLLGLSLALPELFIGIASALDDKPQIALGGVVGANLANLSLVIGGVAIMNKVIPVVGDYLGRDLWMVVGVLLLPFLMLGDGVISRVEGVVLLLLYFAYSTILPEEKKVAVKHATKKMSVKEELLWAVIFVLGLLIIASSAWLLVQLVVGLASSWRVSLYWIGLILIAFGTTIPEAILVLKKKSRATLALPGLMRSLVTNSTLVLGAIALIRPVMLEGSVQRGLSGLFLVIILGLFWLFTKSKRKLERWEGVVLVGVYLMFIGLQMILV